MGNPHCEHPMNEDMLTIMAAGLGACCLLAAFLGHRSGDEKRDVQLMMGIGVAFAGIALIIISIQQF